MAARAAADRQVLTTEECESLLMPRDPDTPHSDNFQVTRQGPLDHSISRALCGSSFP